LNLNFFDESAQELSSIDHSAAAVDSYGYQAGPNPYEQAKRQYLKKSMLAQSQGVSGVNGGPNGEEVARRSDNALDHHQLNKVDEQPYERVNNFISPMVVGL
jgi:hypothetical protein